MTTLNELLRDPEFLPVGPRDLLVLLAAASESPSEDALGLLPWPLDGRFGAADLDAWLYKKIPDAPKPADRERWLKDISMLARAHRGVARIPALSWAGPVLAAHLKRLEAAVRGASWAWMWAIEAEDRQDRGELPWRAISPGGFDALRAGPVDRAAFSRLEQGRLHPRDAASLNDAIASPGPWREAWSRWESSRRAPAPTPFEEAFQALVRARSEPSAEAVLLLAGHLLSAPCLAAMEDAVASLESGREEGPDTVGWVAFALEGRLLVERRMDDERVLLTGTDIDQRFASLSSAILLLDEATWSAIVGDAWLDDEAWWGERAVLTESVERLVAQRAERAVRARPELVWAHAADRIPTEGESPGPGHVRLLVVVGTGAACVRLTVRHAPGEGLFAPDSPLGPWAVRGVRAAWLAAGRLFRQGPRFPLEDHRIEIRAPSGIDLRVEGQSLALPVALAFASLWSDAPIADELAATGCIRDDLERVGAVEFVALKSRAFAAVGGARLVVAPSNASDVAGVEAISVRTLADALLAAGLAPSEVSFVPAFGSVQQRIGALEQMLRDAAAQHVEPYQVPAISPWLVLGDRMLAVAHSLEDVPHQSALVQRARSTAAKMYLHAGEIELAEGIVENIDRELLPPSVRLILDIAALNSAIDEDPRSAESRCAPLEQTLDALEPDERARLEGRVRGTIGRARMHQRDVPRALVDLEAAVAAHEREPHERPRSRIYLASALRMAGRLHDALDQLQRAQVELIAVRDWHPSYERRTRLFWRMELARTLIAAGRPAEALPLCREGIRDAAWLGLWPLVGLLRTQACAHRALGEPKEAEVCARAIEPWLGKHPIVEGMLREARGDHPEGGEVY